MTVPAPAGEDQILIPITEDPNEPLPLKIGKSNDSSGRTTKSFFMHKGKGTYKDIQAEKDWRLKQIKKAHQPIDYIQLKEHEKSWIAEVYSKKEIHAQKMKEKMQESERSYKINFKSRSHIAIKDSYREIRDSFLNTRIETQAKIDNAKQLIQKQTKMSDVKKDRIRISVDQKFPPIGKNHTNWFYGRFGKAQYSKSVDYENSKKLVSLRYQKGNEYLCQWREFKKTDQYQIMAKKKTQERRKLQLEDEIRKSASKNRDKSVDWLAKKRNGKHWPGIGYDD
jgi:hypothetical protein